MNLQHVCASAELSLAAVRDLSENAVTRPRQPLLGHGAVPMARMDRRQREAKVFHPWSDKWSGGAVDAPRQGSHLQNAQFFGRDATFRNSNRS